MWFGMVITFSLLRRHPLFGPFLKPPCNYTHTRNMQPSSDLGDGINGFQAKTPATRPFKEPEPPKNYTSIAPFF